MENPRRSNRGIEENTLAILDSSGIKEARDVHDDRLAFLEAVRAACLVSESATVPSWKMFDAIFQILRDSKSLEMAMASYQLLTELDKHYPRVNLVNSDKPDPSCSGVGELVVVKEAWSPFVVGSEIVHCVGEGTSRSSHGLLDSLRFFLLIEDIAQAVSKLNFQLGLKAVENMLLFLYLVNVLEADFLPRLAVYKETLNWVLLRESILNMLLVSRRLNFKSLVRDCISIISKRCHHRTGVSLQDLKHSETSVKTVHDCDFTLAMAVTELEKETSTAVQKLLALVMELDVIRKEADMLHCTSRADSLRTPLMELILDDLSYNKDHISPFLQVFCEPRWKLEIVLQYFWKYCAKSSIRTRRSNESVDDVTLEGVLSNFSNVASTKNVVRKISSEVAQLLLAHAFQASLSQQHGLKCLANSTENIEGNSLSHLCKGLISAFQNLKKIDENVDITPFEKEALFTAGIIFSRKS